MKMRFVIVTVATGWLTALAVTPFDQTLAASGTAQSAVPAARSAVQPAGAAGAAEYQALVDRYCVTCHSERLKTAGLVLQNLDLTKVHEQAETWEKVLRRLQLQSMPPDGLPRPNADTYRAFESWLSRSLDAVQARTPEPGRPPMLRRLNRTEYANAVRDLLGLDVNVAAMLPPDDSGYGFDNIADVLGVAPLLLERYLSVAGTISAIAVGDPTVPPGAETYRVRQDLSQDRHVDGLPFGTVGGALVSITVPVDGEYVIEPRLVRTNLGIMRGLEDPRTLDVLVDGVGVHRATFGGWTDYTATLDNFTAIADAVDARLKTRVALKAGRHQIGAAFVQESSLRSWRLQPFIRSSSDPIDINGSPHLDFLIITGPFNPAAATVTPSRQRVFVCQPATAADEAPCARRIVGNLARRAFRRPVAGAELDRLMTFYEQGRSRDFDGGIQLALQRILSSPFFVFRAERAPAATAADGVYRVSDLDLASRLSFFLWSSVPDDRLVTLATDGKLNQPGALAQEVRRMVRDPRFSIVSNFANQWLRLRNLRNIVPNSFEFPDFDDNLRQAMQRETELLFDSIIRENRSVLDLLRADYTFVNERLARHYDIPNIYGDHFRRVRVTDPARQGILGHASILMVTSYANRTSPVQRGKWIVESLLGASVPAPPPNVPPLEENETGSAPKSVRERLEAHRRNPTCASCHKMFDPIGLTMENFDAVGAWRTVDAGAPIDPAGQLLDGSQISGPAQLRQALLRRPELFAQTFVEKLMIYALGRGLDARDMPSVRAIVRDAARDDYRFSTVLLGIVRSPQFQMARKAAPAAPGQRNALAQ